MRHLARAALAIALATATGLAGYAVADAEHAGASTVLGPGLVTVTVNIRYSHFSMSTLKVHAGSTVRFLIRNGDPITHEFIVGDAAVHYRHEHGTHPAHPPVPGEVTVSAGQLGETFFRFDQPGRWLFACHLPGHFAYGMHGWVEVVEK